jgi:hypothetical protein
MAFYSIGFQPDCTNLEIFKSGDWQVCDTKPSIPIPVYIIL